MPRIGVVGATGAVGRVTLELLARARLRRRAAVRLGALGRHARSAAALVEEATPEALAAGDLDVCLFSVGASASRELVPHAVRGGAVCVDKSAAFRLEPGVPLVVPEVNGERAREHDGVVANPNCCAIPLTLALKPLHDAAGLRASASPRTSRCRAQGAQRLAAAARGAAGRARPARPTGTSTARSSTRK